LYLLDSFYDAETVHARHLRVQQNHGERSSFGVSPLKDLERFGPAFAQLWIHLPGEEHFLEYAAISGITSTTNTGRPRSASAPNGAYFLDEIFCNWKRVVEVKSAASVGSLSTQTFPPSIGEPGGNRETQTRAAIFPRGRTVVCVNASKDELLFFQRDADPRIPDGKMQHHLVL